MARSEVNIKYTGALPQTPRKGLRPLRIPFNQRFHKFAVIFMLLIFLITFAAGAAEAGEVRIISLYPGHTENIAALGAEKSIAAISHNDDLESLQSLPRVAANVTPEAVLAYGPDIVIMRSLNVKSNSNLVPALEMAGVRVYILEPPGWDEFEDYLKRLADIIGADPQAALGRLEKIRGMVEETVRERAKNTQNTQKALPPSVFLEATGREIHTCAPDSWAARLIEMCGGVNAAESAEPVRTGSAIAPWGVEKAVELLSSGLDIYLVQQGAMNGSTRGDVTGRAWFKPFDGVRLEFISESDLSRPSLIRLESGAETLLSIFYKRQRS